MKTRPFAAMALILALLPSLASASDLLRDNELKFLVRTCLAHFEHRTGQPVKIDKARLQKMGFAIKTDEAFDFEAQRVIKEGIYRLKKHRFGPTIEMDRLKRRPDEVKFWSCGITSGDSLKTTEAFITPMTSANVQKMIEKEAQSMGFQPTRGKRGKVIWMKNGVPMTLRVAFYTATGQGVTGNVAPSGIYFQGAHPKHLR